MESPARTSPNPKSRAPLIVAAALLVAGAWALLRTTGVGDDVGKAQPAFSALFDGDLQGFFDKQPMMGSLSLYVRAPFAGIADALQLRELASYRLQDVPMLVAAGALGWYAAGLMRERGRSLFAQLVVVGLLLAGPVTIDALNLGHPEEILGATLCVAAVLAAMRGNAIWSGVFVGLAIATKQWGLIALFPALAALSSDRVRMVAIAALTAIALTVPMAIGSPARFKEINDRASQSVATVDYRSVWWPARETSLDTIDAGFGSRQVERYRAPAAVKRIAHPLVVLLPIPLFLLYLRRRRPGSDDVLLLLALCMLLRCVMDPGDLGYYHLPFIFALAVWEGLQRRGVPVVALISSFVVTAPWSLVSNLDPVSPFVFYFVWILPVAVWMCARLYMPEQLDRVVARLRQRGDPVSPTPV